MAFYEHTFIGKQDLTDKEVDSLVTKYSGIINKTGKMTGTMGDVQDFSREMSEKRASMNGGVDPVKQQYYKNYSKERKGAKHPQELKERKFENKAFKVKREARK